MMAIDRPEVRVTRMLESQIPSVSMAADGFPIDEALQRRVRRAAVGYMVLAGYYLAVMPFALRFLRWGSVADLADDLLARAEVLIALIAYLVANVILAAIAWRVISMRVWTSWVVVGVAVLHTVFMVVLLGGGVWRSLPAHGVLGLLNVGIQLVLLSGYVACCLTLARSVHVFAAQRAEVRAQIEGRIGG